MKKNYDLTDCSGYLLKKYNVAEVQHCDIDGSNGYLDEISMAGDLLYNDFWLYFYFDNDTVVSKKITRKEFLELSKGEVPEYIKHSQVPIF